MSDGARSELPGVVRKKWWPVSLHRFISGLSNITAPRKPEA